MQFLPSMNWSKNQYIIKKLLHIHSIHNVLSLNIRDARISAFQKADLVKFTFSNLAVSGARFEKELLHLQSLISIT